MNFNADDRHILVITGEREESLVYATQLSQSLETITVTDSSKAFNFLGHEFDAVIYDLHHDFNPNSFGAITGTLRVGGFLILLRPADFAKSSLFLKRFNLILESNSNVHFINSKNHQTLELSAPIRKNIPQQYATEDQEKAVADIIKVVEGHRRRPLVITSDRGRGKSASLGIAAAELAKKNIDNIILCAPSKKSAAVVFKHAEFSSIKSKSNLTFYSPDDLLQHKPKADLVLIDEAAAIPISMLSTFLKSYSRIVFSSTQYGYEGCGRGFGINFRKVLDEETPEWKACELKNPIRWNDNDTLEQFTFEALLLNADTKTLSASDLDSLPLDSDFKLITKQSLIEDNNKLLELFGLLVSAHYQTKPSDLMQMLDDDSVSIYCLENNETILAVALVLKEGNIDPKLSADIFAGKRRLKGHLVAQALSSNIGIESAIQLAGARVSRIAVHPKLQSKGFGTHLLKKLFENSTCDYLSTSYGATAPLLHFWKNLGFSSVHLGIKRDASSGSHSVTMLKGKTSQGIELSNRATTFFDKSFPHLLSDCFNELEPEIIFAILSNQEYDFDEDELKIISAFANDSRGYENAHYLLWKLVASKLANNQNLSMEEQKILIIKVLQKQPWGRVKQQMKNDVSGKKEALKLLRKATRKLLG